MNTQAPERSIEYVVTPMGTVPNFPRRVIRPWMFLYRRSPGQGISPYFMFSPTVIIVGTYLLIWRILFLTIGSALWLLWTASVITVYLATSVLCYFGHVFYRLAQLTYVNRNHTSNHTSNHTCTDHQ